MDEKFKRLETEVLKEFRFKPAINRPASPMFDYYSQFPEHPDDNYVPNKHEFFHQDDIILTKGVTFTEMYEEPEDDEEGQIKIDEGETPNFTASNSPHSSKNGAIIET
jgi:hypothetical protein